MNNLESTQWRQSFEEFKRSYNVLDKYACQDKYSVLERAGLFHIYRMTLELSIRVITEYLEEQGYEVKSPRETIKQAYQIELIEDGHTWLEAISKRSLTNHTYDESVAEKIKNKIKELYTPLVKNLYERLEKE